MTDRTATFSMEDEQRKALCLRYIAGVKIGAGLEVVVRKVRRTDRQNRRWWSMLGALAASGYTGIAGREWDQNGWHDIAISLWRTEKRGETPTIVEGAAGEFLSMWPSSRDLTVEEFSDLMASTLAFIDQHGIEWLERNVYPEDR